MRVKRVLLALIAGILLGLLAFLVLTRYELRRAGELSPAQSPAALESPAPTAEQPIPVTPAEPESPPPSPEAAPAPDYAAAVGEIFDSFAQTQTGRWGLCFLALPDGEPVLRDGGGGPMVSASLIKLPVMAAVYEKLERGELDRETAERRLGPMITVSDNASANALIRLLGGGDEAAGMAAVNDWCARQGLGDTRLNRLMLVDNGLQNYTSAADCAALLAAVYRGDCVSPEASREMLALLLGQTVKDRLPRGLPEGTPIAHKTGDLIGLCWADVGIVFSPGGDYILCVISDGLAGELEAKDAAAALSRQIYDLLNPTQ